MSGDEKGSEKVLITAALPYANGPLHFGHIAGAYLPADCYARYKRMNGDDVLFICGSDEYGIAITISAELAGRTPQQQVDLFHGINKELFKKLNVCFDHYGRTTTKRHAETTKEFFFSLLENGHIEEKMTEQLYSPTENKFLADRYVEGTCPKCKFDKARGDECPKCGASFEAVDLIHPRSKITGSQLVKKSTKHWFLKFDHFKDQLSDFLSTKDWKPNVKQFAKHYIEELRERAITRDTPWGIPVPLPHAEGKVFYVWFDAPIGYISITQEWAELSNDKEAWKDYWLDPKTRLIQFIGKDNIPFHAVFFPAMIMGQDKPYILVNELPANEFYNLEGKQFSKSSGWTIDLERFFTNFSADMIRYTIASNAPETGDSEFSWKDFQQRVNGDLVGKYGNFANRVLTFIVSKMNKPDLKFERLDEMDHEFIESIEKLSFDTLDAFEQFRVRKACQLIMEIASLGNAYFDAKKPWVLIKDKTLSHELEKVMALCLYALKLLALISYPVIPESAEKLWAMLGFEECLKDASLRKEIKIVSFNSQDLQTPTILFKKIEDSVIEQEIAQLQTTVEKPAEYAPLKPSIDVGVFDQADLRVGKILHAERVEKSKKLLKLTIDIGFETRTIVSGISLHFTDLALLIGKKVIVIANLHPAKLMGVESQGMLLSAELHGQLEIPCIQSLNPGAVVR